MNWVGGIRSRLRGQNEKKQQKEFFERQRLQRRIDRGLALGGSLSGRRGVSQDILSLHTVRKTHNAAGTDSLRHRKVVAVDLDKSRPVNRLENVDLPNMSPIKMPSQINLMDFRKSQGNGNVHAEEKCREKADQFGTPHWDQKKLITPIVEKMPILEGFQFMKPRGRHNVEGSFSTRQDLPCPGGFGSVQSNVPCKAKTPLARPSLSATYKHEVSNIELETPLPSDPCPKPVRPSAPDEPSWWKTPSRFTPIGPVTSTGYHGKHPLEAESMTWDSVWPGKRASHTMATIENFQMTPLRKYAKVSKALDGECRNVGVTGLLDDTIYNRRHSNNSPYIGTAATVTCPVPPKHRTSLSEYNWDESRLATPASSVSFSHEPISLLNVDRARSPTSSSILQACVRNNMKVEPQDNNVVTLPKTNFSPEKGKDCYNSEIQSWTPRMNRGYLPGVGEKASWAELVDEIAETCNKTTPKVHPSPTKVKKTSSLSRWVKFLSSTEPYTPFTTPTCADRGRISPTPTSTKTKSETVDTLKELLDLEEEGNRDLDRLIDEAASVILENNEDKIQAEIVETNRKAKDEEPPNYDQTDSSVKSGRLVPIQDVSHEELLDHPNPEHFKNKLIYTEVAETLSRSPLTEPAEVTDSSQRASQVASIFLEYVLQKVTDNLTSANFKDLSSLSKSRTPTSKGVHPRNLTEGAHSKISAENTHTRENQSLQFNSNAVEVSMEYEDDFKDKTASLAIGVLEGKKDGAPLAGTVDLTTEQDSQTSNDQSKGRGTEDGSCEMNSSGRPTEVNDFGISHQSTQVRPHDLTGVIAHKLDKAVSCSVLIASTVHRFVQTTQVQVAETLSQTDQLSLSHETTQTDHPESINPSRSVTQRMTSTASSPIIFPRHDVIDVRHFGTSPARLPMTRDSSTQVQSENIEMPQLVMTSAGSCIVDHTNHPTSQDLHSQRSISVNPKALLDSELSESVGRIRGSDHDTKNSKEEAGGDVELVIKSSQPVDQFSILETVSVVTTQETSPRPSPGSSQSLQDISPCSAVSSSNQEPLCPTEMAKSEASHPCKSHEREA